MERRNFIRKAAAMLLTATGALAALSYLRQFVPPRAGERRRLRLGDPGRYPVDTYSYLEDYQLFVYRDHEGIRAVSAICTHLGCILNKSTDGFECPCHGSRYNEEGEVLSGPAPADLPWYRVGRSADGSLFVDPGSRVDPGEKFLTA